MFKMILASLALSLAALSAHALQTADQMTCSQLLSEVKSTGRYYKASKYDGPLPIYGFKLYDESGRSGHCGRKKVAQPIYERTTDTPHCLVGYICG